MRIALLALSLFVDALPASAQTPQTDVASQDAIFSHPWVRPAPRGAESYFTNLKDGGVYEAPFMARFGLSMRGLVPAGKTVGNAGHHHLLINQELPLDLKKSLPFSDKYIHFGKGQMEKLVDLPPGEHTFRLLLADKDHVLYFVYSRPLKFTISRQNKDVVLATVVGAPRVEILSPANRETVRGAFRVQFHASGYNVSHVDAKAPETGHFRLTIEQVGRKPEVLSFAGGQTETWLQPPGGAYSMQLDFISNADDKTVLTKAAPTAIMVSSP